MQIMMQVPFMGMLVAGIAVSAKRDRVDLMSRDFVNAFCRDLPGAQWSEPFGPGHDVWKVGDKIFASIFSKGTGVIVKCPDVDTADMLKEVGAAMKAPYFHKSWVLVPFERADEGEVIHRLQVSYDVIRAGLTKKVQAALPG